jgi:hypothetical protein
MLGMEQLILQELQRSFQAQGMKVDTALIGNEVVITISSEELKNAILSSIPPPWRSYVDVECGSIKVKIKLVFGGVIQ